MKNFSWLSLGANNITASEVGTMQQPHVDCNSWSSVQHRNEMRNANSNSSLIHQISPVSGLGNVCEWDLDITVGQPVMVIYPQPPSRHIHRVLASIYHGHPNFLHSNSVLLNIHQVNMWWTLQEEWMKRSKYTNFTPINCSLFTTSEWQKCSTELKESCMLTHWEIWELLLETRMKDQEAIVVEEEGVCVGIEGLVRGEVP